MKTHYWQNVVDKTVTKTSSSRKPSILHKRITKSAYEAISGLTQRAADGAVCTALYHISLAYKGDTVCGVCHQPLRR